MTRNGDVLFAKETRAEYYRYEAQKVLQFGGFNPWRWRTYLRPPKVPEKVKEQVKRKIAELARRMKPQFLPQPSLRPVPIFVRSNIRRFARKPPKNSRFRRLPTRSSHR